MPEPRLTRRDVLRGAALATGAVVVGSNRAVARTNARPDRGSSKRVVVMGAGLAGLTAALDLVATGWDVVVVEARSRVGGRVHTLHAPFSAGLHAEAGGESIDDGHKDVLAMIDRFGLRTERREPQKPYDATVYYRGERSRLPEFLARRGGQVLRDVMRFYDATATLADGVDPEHPERARNAERLDARSLEDFLVAQRLVPEAEFLMRMENRGEYAAELRDISLLFVAQQEAVSPSGTLSLVTAETMRVSGGNSLLPEAMAAALGSRIRLGAAVTRIDHDRHGVRVHVGARTIDAAWLVVATPMMPLRHVHFAPALPHSLAAVVRGLDLGHAVKVTREYAVPFWTAEAYSGFTVTDLPFAIGWSPTDSYVAAHGLFSEFVTGDAAASAARQHTHARISHAQAQLDRIYPEATPLVTPRVKSTVWAHERYTGGGYAVYRPGQMAPYFATLRAGTGRIRFAGEHTSALAGYMESAVRSGHRVAAEIARSAHPAIT